MIYPAISSTAAKAGFKLIYAKTFRPSLAFDCIRRASLLERDERLAFLGQLSLYSGLSATVNKNYWFLAGQRRHAEERQGTTDGDGHEGSVVSLVESSTDVDADGEEEVEISSISKPSGDFKADRKTRTSEVFIDDDGSSSDSDYCRFGSDSWPTERKGKRADAPKNTKKRKKSKYDSSDSSDFFEPNSQAVAKRSPSATVLSTRKKFRLGSQRK